MPCTRPLSGWRSRVVNASGKRSITWSKGDALLDFPVALPCGRCLSCRLEKSRQWAVRCLHEASLYDNNCFVTLTYSDEFLPPHGFLDYDAPVLFMKRVRARFGAGIRSYGCAEYGEDNSRPHYHLCLFNFDFSDKYAWRKTKPGDFQIWRSSVLEELWPFGLSELGSMSFESAAYVARYCTKVLTGRRSLEYGDRPPERSICVSRRPGIGREWFEKWKSSTFPNDRVVVRGVPQRPPLYYDRLYCVSSRVSFRSPVSGNLLDCAPDFDKVRRGRKARALNFSMREFSAPPPELHSYDRWRIKEFCLEAKFKLLVRGLENG